MIIASNRPGTIGAQDLWVSTRNAVGDPWLAPVNLGPVINSSFNDNFPSCHRIERRSSSARTDLVALEGPTFT